MKRLTSPMRQVLLNLYEGRAATHGMPMGVMNMNSASTVLRALEKRCLVALNPDATYRITHQGRAMAATIKQETN